MILNPAVHMQTDQFEKSITELFKLVLGEEVGQLGEGIIGQGGGFWGGG